MTESQEIKMGLSYEEIKKKIDAGDQETINGVIDGSIVPEQVEVPQSTVDQIPVETTVEDIQQVTEPTPNPLFNELEQQRKYAEMLAKREQEKQEEYFRKLEEYTENLNKEKKAKEELENRLRQLELQIDNKSTISQNDQTSLDTSDEDQFVSDYAKKTRQALEELQKKFPEVTQITEELNSLKQVIASEKKEKEMIAAEEAKKRQQQQLFDSIREFQIANPELQTKKNIKELNDEYLQFRKDISYITNSKSIQELENAIEDYFKGGETKTKADQNGIKPIDDYEKFVKIMELIDLKEGVKYDPKKGDYIPITDDTGARIRYRSLSEAYKINNYYDELNNARKKAYQDVNRKLTQINGGPVVLAPTQTSTFETTMTADQIREIINWPVSMWKNNPQKRAMVEQAYSAIGSRMPNV